jgi:arylsulfatase A-like enzyme
MRQFFFALAMTTNLLSVVQANAAVEKPNILFVMVDDLGKDWISCYGADDIKTPHIDALAKSGLKFHNAYSMPQCTPTRATLLTGQYPLRTGWVNHWDVPRWGVGYFDWEKYTTFGSVMKSAGYTTAIAGKWQINDFRLEPQALKKHGFDDWAIWTGYEAMNPPSGERYWDAYIHTKAGSKTYKNKFGPDIYCNFLIDFMKQQRSEPMMLYFPMALTHGPLVHTPDEPKVDGKRGKLKAMVHYTDALVGRLVKSIDDLGLRKRTIIIFTTDNGTSGGIRGTIGGIRPSGGKASDFEGGVCQPFIVNCPGLVPEGAETDALTDFSDLLPTFAELGGAKLPQGVTLDGKSFAPLILGKADDSPREWILAMGHGAAKMDEKGVRGRDDYTTRVIRDKRFKVWVKPNRRIDALYDLKNDPLEQNNLLKRDSRNPAIEAALKKFNAVVASMPANDARPQYRPRKANPWDRKPQVVKEGKKKKKKRKNQPRQAK